MARLRDVFERRFTATVMARNYLRLYWRLYAGLNHVIPMGSSGENVHARDGLPGLLMQPAGHDLAGHVESSPAIPPRVRNLRAPLPLE